MYTVFKHLVKQAPVKLRHYAVSHEQENYLVENSSFEKYLVNLEVSCIGFGNNFKVLWKMRKIP